MRRRSFPTIIVGPSPLVREGLARVLGAAAFRIAASAPCIDDLVLDSILNQQPILLIIDTADHPGETAEQIALFKKQHPTARIAVVAGQYELNDMVAAFRSGANAYFIRVANCDALIKSLDLVMLGETILPPEVLPFIQVRENKTDDKENKTDDKAAEGGLAPQPAVQAEPREKFAPHLSGREKNVLRCLLNGDANKVIARKNDIAEATVKVHIKTILRKIRVENRTQAALWAMNNLPLVESEESTAPAKAVSQPKVTTLCVSASPKPEHWRDLPVSAEISAARLPARSGARR